MKRAKFIVVAGLLGLLWLLGCGGPDWSLADLSRPIAPRPSHYGFSLPYPVSAPPIEMSERVYSAIVPKEAERVIPVILNIDVSGRILSMTAQAAGDSDYLNRYGVFLEQFRFEPGLIDGVVSPMSLLVELQTGSVTASPIIRFPVDPNRDILDGDLYWRALAELGVDVPTLVRFPSYNYEFKTVYRWRRYPFKVYRVDLDSAGKVLDKELVLETGPEFSRQIRSAIHWGEYTPLRIDGRAVASSSFLVVSLYPMVDYPSAPVEPSAPIEMVPWDRARVRLLPDTIGIVLPPVPKREWSGDILDSFHQGMTPELVTGRVIIDTLGKSHVQALSTDFARARSVIIARAHDIQFFPTMGLDGVPRAFSSGMVYLRYLDKSHVRIWFRWLGGVDPGPPVQTTELQ